MSAHDEQIFDWVKAQHAKGALTSDMVHSALMAAEKPDDILEAMRRENIRAIVDRREPVD